MNSNSIIRYLKISDFIKLSNCLFIEKMYHAHSQCQITASQYLNFFLKKSMRNSFLFKYCHKLTVPTATQTDQYVFLLKWATRSNQMKREEPKRTTGYRCSQYKCLTHFSLRHWILLQICWIIFDERWKALK